MGRAGTATCRRAVCCDAAMRRVRRLVTLALLAVVAAAAPASAQAADTPKLGSLSHEGPSGRYLLGGEWLFRLDNADQGLRQHFMRERTTRGWSKASVPSAWNTGDDSNASMAGGIGWYRKNFKLPSARGALQWAVQFGSVNYRSRVWLNGRPIGTNKGAYIPFEMRLAGLKRRGVNRLVIRVDSRRRPTDFPPSGLSTTGVPTGGWWNYSGILREVYLDKLDTVDFKQVRVRPQVRGSASAVVEVRAVLRNVTSSTRRIRVAARFGGRRLRLGSREVGPSGVSAFTARVRVRKPRLWSPADPNLYPVSIAATAGGRTVGSYKLETGIRSIRVVDGRLMLNGQFLNLRGVGYHEDSKELGFAVDNPFRRRLMGEAKQLGATIMRTHYPPHPYLQELADRRGMLLWSEVPVYAIKTPYLAKGLVRQLAAKELRKNIEANQNHPSVLLWSIANELSPNPGPVQADYIKSAARLAKQLDPTRPVGIAVAGYASAGCQPAYAPLDVIGVNEYFGWYPGPSGQLFDRNGLSGYLDSVRQCYPDKAIMVSEFGAEANREGPLEEKGTWAFQQDFVNYHLGVYASKPWLSGALYWAINEFRVRPAWDGGNPRPQPPVHQKGLTVYGSWAHKPAWADTQRWYSQTRQFIPPG
jgi:beta-glucuronidase